MSWERTVRELADSDHDLYLGVDVGRTSDLTVYWLIEKTGGVAFTRRIVELQGVKFSEQERILYELLCLPRLRRACIDSTGLGMQFAERAAERFGTYKIEGVRFSGPVKEDLAYPVRKAFEDRSVRIPRQDKIETDLRSIRKETTSAGNIRFTAERDKDGHADRFWALALAIHAAKQSNHGHAACEPVKLRNARRDW